MGKKGYYYDQASCIGCRVCQTACKDKNDLPIGIVFRQVTDYEVGRYPAARMYHFAATCNHCENPACVKACPSGAMHVDALDGTVQHASNMCIGCQYCVNACPYGNPKFNQETKKSMKCDACMVLRSNGEQPACVGACPMRALQFGEYDQLLKEHPDAQQHIVILPESVTQPCLLINPHEAALEEDPQKVIL